MGCTDANTLFRKEFKKMMIDRRSEWLGRSECQIFEIPKLPICPNIVNNRFGQGMEVVGIKGIQEPYFSSLNGKIGCIEKRDKWYKKKIGEDGQPLRDAKTGEIIQSDVAVPSDSVVISSEVNIKLPYTKLVGVQRKLYEPTKGYKYIDYEQVNAEKRVYYYIIPKACAIKVNLCAFILSNRTLTRGDNYYIGYKVALQNGNYLYVYVAPYTRKYAKYRVVSLKPSPDFTKEIRMLFYFWMHKAITFPTELCKIEGENLGYTYLEGTISKSDYQVFGNSLDAGTESDNTSFYTEQG